MRNLKINNRIKALIAAGVMTFTFAGCGKQSDSNPKEVYTITDSVLESDNVQYIVIDNTLVTSDQIKLADKKGTVIEELDGVIFNKQIQAIENPALIKFSDEIAEVILNNEIHSVDDFKLINISTGKEVSSIQGYVNADGVIVYAGSSIDSLEDTSVVDVESIEDTVISYEDFVTTVDNFTCRLEKHGVKVNRNDVFKTAILLNSAMLSKNNSELYNQLLIEANVSSINDLYIANANVQNAINNPDYNTNHASNYYRFYEEGVPFDELLDLEDLVMDEKQQKLYSSIATRCDEMSYMLDTYELDDEVAKLYTDFNNGTYDELTADTKLALNIKLDNLRGMVFHACTEDDRAITPMSQIAVKFLAPFTSDESEQSLYNFDNCYSELNGYYEGTGRALTK